MSYYHTEFWAKTEGHNSPSLNISTNILIFQDELKKKNKIGYGQIS